MDIIHHTLIGGAGYLIAADHGQELAGMAFLAASVLPDCDVFFMLIGKRFYLKHHQGISHSVLLSPVIALLICLPLLIILDLNWNWLLFTCSWAGLLLHAGIDWLNTFGVALLFPLTKRRYCIDSVFFIDSITWGLTGLFYVSYSYFKIEEAAIFYPLLFISYVIFKSILHQRVMVLVKPLYAIPSSLNPLDFYILVEKDNHLSGYLYNYLTKTTRKEEDYPRIEEEYIRLAEQSRVFQDMTLITRALNITDVIEDESGTTISAADLAVRNYGGRFARTTLKYDKQRNLVYEMAKI